jgi:hypothetical protein
MDNINLQPTPPEPNPEPAETPSAETIFIRGFLGKISSILREDADAKKRLTGHARLVAELLDSTGKVFLWKSEYEAFAAWQKKADELQQVHLAHTNTEADAAFFKQQASLHEKASEPGFDHSSILSRDAWREKFQAIRLSAFAAQEKLFRENFPLAKKLSARVAEILLEELPALEESERQRFARYGLPNTSPIPAAVRAAAKFVTDRTTSNQGTGSPREILPWLLL